MFLIWAQGSRILAFGCVIRCMLIGVVGAPNKGKSTFFSAATLVDAQIANYPFTTIEPNRGVGYVRCECPCKSLGVKCEGRNSVCENGVRLVPVNMLDVAGLVPGAHEGKGKGNQFLDDLRQADALIQVVDASGGTDLEGNPASNSNPAEEMKFLVEEIDWWIAGILKRNWSKIRGQGLTGVYAALTGFGASEIEIKHVVEKLGMEKEKIQWTEEEALRFATEIRKMTKPIVVAANKCDLPGAREKAKKLIEELRTEDSRPSSPKDLEAGDRRSQLSKTMVFPCSAAAELALRKANKAGVIKYVPGARDFEILETADERQRRGLEAIRGMVKEHGTGVQDCIDRTAKEVLRLIVVYPVEDEHKFCDSKGRVLPDAYLVPEGTTAWEFAGKIHTDLQKRFIGAMDARAKRRVGKEHVLKDGDIIKIFAN